FDFPESVILLATKDNVSGVPPGHWDAIDLAGDCGRLDWIQHFVQLASLAPSLVDLPYFPIKATHIQVVQRWLDQQLGPRLRPGDWEKLSRRSLCSKLVFNASM